MDEEKKIPFYLQAGFKKLIGGILSIIGGILCIIPSKNQGLFYVGTGIAGIGTLLLGVGAVHTAVKISKGEDRSVNVWKTMSEKVRAFKFNKEK